MRKGRCRSLQAPAAWVSLARGLGVAALVLTLSACQNGVLDPHGPIGRSERTLLLDATVVMLAVVIPVILLTLYFAWWFRAGNALARYRPDWEYSGRIEFIVWAIPALLIMFLGGTAWISAHDLDPQQPLESSAAPLEVRVVALDWRWLFIYPSQHIATLNHLTIPVGTPVHFELTATSVMNSFFIPQLGSQIYAMPKMTTQLNLVADAVGQYGGLSAQFSGDGFSDMHFDVDAVTGDDFKAWVAGVQVRGERLDAAAMTELVLPKPAAGAVDYGQVDEDLFMQVVHGTFPTKWPATVP